MPRPSASIPGDSDDQEPSSQTNNGDDNSSIIIHRLLHMSPCECSLEKSHVVESGFFHLPNALTSVSSPWRLLGSALPKI